VAPPSRPPICARRSSRRARSSSTADVNPALRSEMKSLVRGQTASRSSACGRRRQTSVKIGDMEMSWAGRDGEVYPRKVLLTWSEPGKDGRQGDEPHPRRAGHAQADGGCAGCASSSRSEDARMPTAPVRPLTTVSARRTTVEIDVDEDPSRTDTKRGQGRDAFVGTLVPHRAARAAARQEEPHGRAWDSHRKFLGEYWRRVALGPSPLAFALLGVRSG